MNRQITKIGCIVALLVQGNYAFAQCAKTTAYTMAEALKDSLCISQLILKIRKMEQLPPTVGKLKNVEMMDLQKNQFVLLPDEIGEVLL